MQAASAKIFGFSGLSILLPEAVAGVLSVALLYYLVRRRFGPVAGLIAALALAVSPVSVVTNRNNTIDSLLVLTLPLASWAVSLAAEKGRLRWLLLTALLVGVGFNIKMLQAYLVVPAFGLVYLLGAPLNWRKRILHLLQATLVLLVVSLSWVLTVDLISTTQRPYVGSSQTNSELELAFGYNGVERLLGLNTGLQSAITSRSSSAPTVKTPSGPGENGNVGLFRLFNRQLGGQIGWLIPQSILGLVAAIWQERLRLPLNPRQQSLIMWGIWLATMYVFFSIAGFFHQYYLSMLAPAICALIGIGLVSTWRDYRRGDRHAWLLPIALFVTALVQVTPNATIAEPLILTTGKAVMALGGFLGTDPILTVQQLQTLIKSNTVRFFYLQGVPNLGSLPPQIQELIKNGGSSNLGRQNLTLWVAAHCKVVPSTFWSSNPDNNAPFPGSQEPPNSPGATPPPSIGGVPPTFPGGGYPLPGGGIFGMQLYDCAN